MIHNKVQVRIFSEIHEFSTTQNGDWKLVLKQTNSHILIVIEHSVKRIQNITVMRLLLSIRWALKILFKWQMCISLFIFFLCVVANVCIFCLFLLYFFHYHLSPYNLFDFHPTLFLSPSIITLLSMSIESFFFFVGFLHSLILPPTPAYWGTNQPSPCPWFQDT